MDLSKRLTTIVAVSEKCECIADIGTDHGYIPIFLIENNICNKVIASDINKGPVNKAKLNVSMAGLAEKIDCRLGSGLNTLGEKEAQGVIIAGMGGNLIKDIIQDRMDIFRGLKFAVLQPVQNPEVLRKYIYNEGYKIIDEQLCFDEGIYYEIIKVKYAKEPVELDSIFYEISPLIVKNKHPLAKNFITWKIEKYNKIINAIKDDSEAAINRKVELAEKLNKLKELLQWL